MRCRLLVLSLLVSTSFLVQCTPLGLAVGAGATVGNAAARDGGLSEAWSDTKITTFINDAWFKHSTEMFRRLNLTVKEGRVLVTGTVPNQQFRVDAVRLAWQAPGVRQVINEIQVKDSDGISGYARDVWINKQMRWRLVFDKNIQSINFNFDTVGGVVYLMGVARDQEELSRVIYHARAISYVREVVSYVRLQGQAKPAAMANQVGSTNKAPVRYIEPNTGSQVLQNNVQPTVPAPSNAAVVEESLSDLPPAGQPRGYK